MRVSRDTLWNWLGCAIFAIVLLLVVTLPPPRVQEVSASAIALPERVGPWEGRHLKYCQSERCMSAFLAERVSGLDKCPLCNAPLGPVNLAVLQGLPEDTIVRTLSYASPIHDTPISVALVVSGRQQKSIHRPEQCLPGQGYLIQESVPMTVPLQKGSSLNVRLIHARSEQLAQPPLLFAYWFRGGHHETSSHWRRLYLMSRDLLVDNVAYPWLYVSVQMPGSSDERSIETLRDFIEILHPALEFPAR
jgi:hypothetical protein